MNNYFCVLPFFGYEFGPYNGAFNEQKSGTHCCLLPPEYNIDELRESILSGQRSNYCRACWNLEDAGLVSDRVLKNNALDFYADKDIKFIEEDVKQGNYDLRMVKLITSNTCNATCVTCNSASSSAWAPLELKLNKVPAKAKTMTQGMLDENLSYKKLVTLNFVGGEPLVEKLNFYVLEKLIEQKNTDCFISFTTNGSFKLTDYQTNLLKQFKNFNIGLSIDGIGPVFEYMRYPLKWDTLLSNLDFFKSLTDKITANYTISNLNVFYHHETVAWFLENNLPFHYNPLIEPRYFRSSALPEYIKKEILARNPDDNDLNLLVNKPHTNEDEQDFQKMLEVTALQDSIKNISLKDYLPELHRLF